MNQKYYKWIFIIVTVLILILLIVLFWNKIFPPKDEKEQQAKEQEEYKQAVEEAKKDNKPTPSAPTLPEGTLPLNVKDKNKKVQAMQNALIKLGCPISAGATAYFGSQTQTALKCAGYNDSKIEQADYDSILAGKKKITVVKAGDSLEANKNGVQLYDSGILKTITKNVGQFIGTAISVNPSTNLVKFKTGSVFGYVYLNDVQVA